MYKRRREENALYKQFNYERLQLSNRTRTALNRAHTSDPMTRFRVSRVKPELHLFEDSWECLTGFPST